MKQLSGGQAAVASLQTEKVEQVFGLIGSATMEISDALYDATEINFIGVHDERTGTHMADGCARASGKAGVILAELCGAAGFKVERIGEVGEAVQAALDCERPAVIDIAIDPAALYRFRRDSFKHRGG